MALCNDLVCCSTNVHCGLVGFFFAEVSGVFRRYAFKIVTKKVGHKGKMQGG